MSKFKEGTKVIFVEDNEIKRGTIKKVFDNLDTVFIDLEDGSVVKKLLDNVAIDQSEPVEDLTSDEKSQEEKTPKNKFLDENLKSEITITREAFSDVIARVTAREIEKMGPKGLLLGMSFTLFASKIQVELFRKEENND